MPQNFKKWLAVEKANCPQFLQDKLGEKCDELLAEKVRKTLAYCSDEEAAKRFFDYCKIEGTTISDFLYRPISTPLGDLIAAIRMIGGDLSKSAVFIIYKDFDLDTPEKIKQIGAILKETFSIFQPQRIRWNVSGYEKEFVGVHDFLTGDLVYVAEFLDFLKARPLPLHFDKIKLQAASSLAWYEIYAEACAKIYSDPARSEWGEVESKETLGELMSKGLLYEVLIDKEWAGIIAVNKETEDILSGYLIYEELILEQFRGQHLASAVQRHLIECLPDSSNEMLFGTIHYDNIPSLKTALRVGRKVVSMSIFSGLD